MLTSYQWIGLSEQNVEGVWSWLDQNVNIYLSQTKCNHKHIYEASKPPVPKYLSNLFNLLYNSTNL